MFFDTPDWLHRQGSRLSVTTTTPSVLQMQQPGISTMIWEARPEMWVCSMCQITMCFITVSACFDNCAVVLLMVQALATLQCILSDAARSCISTEAETDPHSLTTLCSTFFRKGSCSLTLSHVCSLSGNPVRALACWRAVSLSREEGIHVPVLRTLTGHCRNPALPPAPVLSV